jgi:hypothetical protein
MISYEELEVTVYSYIHFLAGGQAGRYRARAINRRVPGKNMLQTMSLLQQSRPHTSTRLKSASAPPRRRSPWPPLPASSAGTL